MSKVKFYPEEVIFAPTGTCNLKCPHCFVKKTKYNLKVSDAIKFLESCKGTTVRKVSFSGGGEPFLAMDFLVEVIKYCIDNAYNFGRIMTNGIWWQSKEELTEKLTILKEAGYDGKIGLSWDSFHGQKISEVRQFCREVFKIFDGTSVEIQSVISQFQFDLKNLEILAKGFDCGIEYDLDKNTGVGTIFIKGKSIFIPVMRQSQSFLSTDTRAWKSDKWFKDDFCEGPGQVLFVHPNGNIAPCCGFANENKELCIGTIKQDFDTIMHQASKNPMLKICYNDGLSKQIKELKKNGVEIPGKTSDICAFCDFVCKNQKF